MEDPNFEDLLLKDNSWNVHENNMHTLLIEICKSINNLSPPIMKYFLLKLPETSTSRYGALALCFKGSLVEIRFRTILKTLTIGF